MFLTLNHICPNRFQWLVLARQFDSPMYWAIREPTYQWDHPWFESRVCGEEGEKRGVWAMKGISLVEPLLHRVENGAYSVYGWIVVSSSKHVSEPVAPIEIYVQYLAIVAWNALKRVRYSYFNKTIYHWYLVLTNFWYNRFIYISYMFLKKKKKKSIYHMLLLFILFELNDKWNFHIIC